MKQRLYQNIIMNNTPVLDLPTYHCDRSVQAARITGIAPACKDNNTSELTLEIPGKPSITVAVPCSFIQKNNPVIGGHYVRTQGGQECYVSHEEFSSIYKGA